MSVKTLRRPPKILVVDDEAALRRAMCVALAATGFVVEEARTGEEALEAIRDHRFELVLLDLNMAGLSGIETCRHIRSFAPRAGIVIFTARDDVEDKIRALDAGADYYVTKPCRFRKLKAHLEAVLRRTQSDLSEEPGS
jgi:DNA-binding response OmpR family regulator